MRVTRTLLVAGVVAAALGVVSSPGRATAPPTPTFGKTVALPPAPGLGLKHNADAEPGIGVAPDGQIWIASDVDPGTKDPRVTGGLLSGSDVWTSKDGGKTFRWVADPFGSGSSHAGLGGEDTDIAVAPAKNGEFYNVYVGSLYVGNTSLAYSTDGGKTFTLLPGDGSPAQDREWLAADGPCTVYIGYHQNPGTQLPLVSTVDVCDPSKERTASALSPADTQRFLSGSVPFESNLIGKLVVDTTPGSPYQHRVYFPMEQCLFTDLTTDPIGYESGSAPSCTGKAELIVGVSSDGGTTFTDVHVATSPQKSLGIWPSTMAVDRAGTVYYAWHDNHHSYLNTSRDGGMTWSPSLRVDGLKSAAVYPTVAAGAAGRVDVTWVGTPTAGDSNDKKVFGKPGIDDSAPWRIYDARSTDSGHTFVTQPMSDVVHRGALCTFGGACAGDGSRDFLDDFGAVVNPRTGLLTTVFSSDQPTGKRAGNFTAFVTERAAAPPAVAPSGPRRTNTPPPAAGRGLPATGLTTLLGALALALLSVGLLARRLTR